MIQKMVRYVLSMAWSVLRRGPVCHKTWSGLSLIMVPFVHGPVCSWSDLSLIPLTSLYTRHSASIVEEELDLTFVSSKNMPFLEAVC